MARDLTTGSPMRLIWSFALPTLFGMLFQQFYNMMDTMIVGQLLGASALASVGSTSSINFFVIGFCMGVCNGFAIPVAQRMGAGDYSQMRRCVANAGWLSALFAVVLTVFTGLFCRTILTVMRTPEDIFDGAYWYILIIFLGIPTTFLYNLLAAVIRALGDSKTPVYFLAISSVLNIALDLLLILYCHAGVAGAALATVLSQMASCAFVLLSLRRKRMPVRLRWGGFSWRIMRRVLAFGLSPFLIIATDSILLIVLNTVLQRYGGPELGDTLVTCATIVQSYLLLITMPMGGLTLGSQPVVSFNYGAANLERIKRAIQSIVALCVTFCVLMTVVTHTLSPVFVGLFTQNPEVAARSVRYIKVFTAMIIPLAIQYPLVDETTALGHVRLALFCSIFRKCVFLAGLLLLPALVSPEATFLSEPIADVVAATVTTCLFLHFFPKILAQRAARKREEREEQPKVAP